jgi:hypothetical protein
LPCTTGSSTRRALAALATSALILAGCGGGSSFTSKADSVCKDTSAKLRAIPRPKAAAGFASYLDKASAVAHGARVKLGALKPPADKAQAYAAYLAALEAQLGVFDRARAVAHAGHAREALLMLVRGQASGRAVKARAKALGLSECAK